MGSALDLTSKWRKVSVTLVNQDQWLFSFDCYVGHCGVKLWYSLLHGVMTKRATRVFNAKLLLSININAKVNRSGIALPLLSKLCNEAISD